MNKTVKGLVAFAMVSTMAGAALFAAPKKKADVKFSEPPAPGTPIEIGIDGPDFMAHENEVQSLVGKLKENKNGWLVFTTDEGDKYVVTTAKLPDGVPYRELKAKAGNRLVLSGSLDKESKIFTVFKIGFMEGPGSRDAK